MLRRLLALVMVLAGLWLPATAQAAKTYHAERYDVQLVLGPDGTLDVTETIVFVFEGGPFTYVFRELAYMELDSIDQVQAALDGQALSPGAGPGQAEIEAGRPLKVIWHLPPTSDASHTFTLTYRVRGAVRQSDADALIWRAIPEEHEYAIKAATVTLTYPPSLRPLETPTLNRAATVETTTAGVAFMASGLDEDEDVIVTARFPKGSLIAAPPAWPARAEARAAATAQAWLFGLAAAVVTVIGGAAALGLIARAYRREGTVEAPLSTPLPPGDLPPALVGRLTGQANGVMGALFDLAQRGRLEIHEQAGWLGTKQHHLELKPGDEPLRAHEQALLDALFKPGRTTLALSEVPMRLAGHRPFEQAVEAELTARGWFDPERKAARIRLVMGWMFGLFVSLGLFLAGIAWGGAAAEAGRDSLIAPAALVGAGAGLFLVSLVGLIQAGSLSTLTEAGEAEAARWKGFGQYLKDVSRGREPVTRPDYFERYLALAAVFGLGAAWARHFQKLGGAPLPVWFHAAAGGHGDFGAIVAVMAASDSSAASAAGGAAGGAGGGASGAG